MANKRPSPPTRPLLGRIWAVFSPDREPGNATHAKAQVEGKSVRGPKKHETKAKPERPGAKELKDWKDALAMATNSERPKRLKLMDLYQGFMYDPQVKRCIEQRKLRVQQSRFNWVNESKEPDEAVNALFRTRWFYDWLGYAIESRFFGYSLIQWTEVSVDGIEKMTLWPRKMMLVEAGKLTLKEGESDGPSYAEGGEAVYYMLIGSTTDLGALKDLGPIILMNKLAINGYDKFVERYGQPWREVNTPAEDNDREEQLLQVLKDMGEDFAIVTREGEKLNLIMPENGANSHQVFEDWAKRLNSSISKALLGQDGTMDNKDSSGTLGSLKVLQDVADDVHNDDRTFIEYLVNGELRESLTMLGYNLNGLTFAWDNSTELTTQEYINAVVQLASHFVIDHEEVRNKTGIPILAQKSTAPAPENPEDDPDADQEDTEGKPPKKVPPAKK